MGFTWIKRLENRSRSTITLLNTHDSNTRGHGIAVPPGSSIAVDMTIPWAAVQTDFPTNHLEIVVGGVTRFWIWQATHADGDFIRFSTDAAWHDPGEHAHGYADSAANVFDAIGGLFSGTTVDLKDLILTDRVIVVLDSHFETIPLAPKPPIPASTFIKQLENRSSFPVTLFSTEGNQTVSAAPGQTIPLNIAVPWALTADDPFFGFPVKHLELALGGVTRFWIWQNDNRNDGDYVRFSTNGTWSPMGTRVRGFAETGVCPGDLVFTADRNLIVTNTDFEVMPHPLLLDGLLDLAQQNMRPARMIKETPMAPAPVSVAKKSAAAFSFSYQQSGKRYEYALGSDGKVVATAADGTRTTLDKAWSYRRIRKGEAVTLPPFDLIAANGHRVFAKAKDADDFYFLGMDYPYVEPTKDNPNANVTIPAFYFKLDPEFAQPTQNPADLLVSMEGIPTNHPGSERLPWFRRVLQKQPSDMMNAKVNPREWQQLDCRPPQNLMPLALRDLILEISPLLLAILTIAPGSGLLMLMAQLTYFAFLKDRWAEYLRQRVQTWGAPPSNKPTFTPVTYRRDDDGTIIEPPAIKYQKVIDIGVGALHYYQQYQRHVGGEIQSLLLVKFYADMYRFFNGPLQDGDGYCDGTINYYALVKHDGPTPTYSLLFQDEQAYFSQRWRVVGPDDVNGVMFSLVTDLSRPEYNWDPTTYWDPFKAGHINDDSRLAVSGQVVLVTGQDPATLGWRIYSINFSWGTMDRTWRWRNLPPGIVGLFNPTAVANGDETIPVSIQSVYPQTIRLRDDMTINIKGTRNSVVGRWYQRYLPADNNLVPSKNLKAGQMQTEGYQHQWRFLPEPVFRLADNFYYFGVYDQVDPRTQYYDVTPATATDAATLDANGSGPWIDDSGQLYVSQWKLRWEDARLLGAKPLDTPSLFNPDTRLRIVRRGSRWVAMFWDKRDDDMTPFERLPRQVTLKKGTATVQVTIGDNHRLLQPPVVQNAYFWLEANGTAGIAFESSVGMDALRESVSRVRMASLDADPIDPTKVARVNWLFDKATEGNFTLVAPNTFQFRWTPTATELPLLQQHANANGESQKATSIWFEDIVGNIAPPQRTLWQRSPQAKGVATPSMIPLGVPTQVTVRASDLRTGAALANGQVKVDGQVVGTTDVPFTFTFNTHVETEFDPELHITTQIVINPMMTVTVPEYPEADVPVTFFTPKLDVRLEPASVPIGPTVQVVVRAEDSTTHTPVAGRVMMAGVDVGPTNVPFNFAFGPTNTSGGVTATGYPTKGFPIALFTPQMQVSVSPSPIPTGLPVQVTVRAVDTRTGLPVNGRVILNGVDVGATNTPFTFTFGLTPPAGVVSAPFYADAAIAWPPLFISTLQTGIMPMPIPINRTIQCTVSAKNAQTGAPIAGRVRIGSTDVAATNTPFTTIFKPKLVGAEQEPVMPTVTVTAFGYNSTTVDTGF